ncbi:MAG: PilZ domain-containing protein [Terriglobales bacterium]
MSLRSLLLSSDQKTARILRRVLSDLEIEVEDCTAPETAIRKLTRQRFEAIILDCSHVEDARSVLKSARLSPANNRAVAIVLVEPSVGMRGGFEMGAHFVLHKPLSGELARSSFRAVRALMKRERRRQVRIAVQLPVECRGLRSSNLYRARTIDLCEGGMAIQFADRFVNENPLRFTLELPGMAEKLEVEGEVAWGGSSLQAGVRFRGLAEDQIFDLRRWLNRQLPEPEQDDPPINCRLSDLSLGGCYLETDSPFPAGTRVILSMRTGDLHLHAEGAVRVMHPEFGMGVEFSQSTASQCEHVRRMIDTLRANGENSAELQVEPDGMEPLLENQAAPAWPAAEVEDSLVQLFRHKSQAPVELFLAEMRQQRQMGGLK